MTKQELAKCIDAYGKDIYSFCRHLAPNVQDAEELYQDTWLKVVEKLEIIDAMGNVKSYCLSVALKLWKNKKRKFAWRKRIAGTRDYLDEEGQEYIPDDRAATEEKILEKERDMLVWNAVNTLPEKMKTVVLLYYMQDLNLAQIAKTADIPMGTVKSRLYQARLLLKKKLEGIFNEK
ncbi:MAG: RNA polymerase sigma factor [Bacteroidales bacterium]|nr:RNA polymerase sigma factor [Lachnoclostridium sp.]MCM1384520.1 RNA polymerase sigma factor [Lachnoclostridium sp.]MCM1464064.1 RNA polymerase sigma factor [Bacteroidales bacterium]